MKRTPPKAKQPHRNPNPDSTIRPLEGSRLRDVRGGDGGITAGDDWEARI